MRTNLFRSIDIWKKVDDTQAIRYRCLEVLPGGKYFVLSADFHRLSFNKHQSDNQERYFFESVLGLDVSQQRETFNTLEEAICNFDQGAEELLEEVRELKKLELSEAVMEARPEKPLILLYSLCQTGLIIICNSGVLYQNQTCNVACCQRLEEGVLVPLLDIPLETGTCPLEEELSQLDWGPVAGISKERANEIDLLLAKRLPTRGLSVDRERLHESEEAWVYVVVRESELAEYTGFGPSKGVLTWCNSD